MALDYVFRIDQPHIRGQLAKVCLAISDADGLIGDIVTINMGRDRSVREISVEVVDLDGARSVAEHLRSLEDVRLLSYYDRALSAHEGGKLTIEAMRPIETLQHMRDVYTPGVARVCTAIQEEPALASRFTMIGRTVAICTNGSRVLGLGDIGPVAAMPVMEGKALFYDQMAGISAMPILIDTNDVEEFVETVVRIAPGFGAIHLEDIRVPDCFEIEEKLRARLEEPVMHDDVHVTGVATLAGTLTACEQVGVDLSRATVGQIGLGAAGFGIASIMVDAGAARVLGSDPNEASHERAIAHGIEIADYETIMRECDVVVATTGISGLIKPEHVREGSVILALTNPHPEIEPPAALAAGAAYAADGTSVNNVLGFPGIFRGALASGASEISTGMKLAAAHAIASLTAESELVPDALDPAVHHAVAKAVEEAARREGLDRPERVPAGL
jgi:malate dehydrogenase (oxaloacetate-decarboxylating)